MHAALRFAMNPPTLDPRYPALGTSLYYALKSAPPGRRDALTAWLRWWHEVMQIPLTVSDPGVAETKLRWWSQELQACSLGQATHPLTKALAHTLPSPSDDGAMLWLLGIEQTQGQIDLVHHTRWMDEHALTAHQLATTGAACEGAAVALGASSPDARAVARQCGLALRQAHQLARLGQDARAGWVHVPIDVLQKHDVRAHQLSKPIAQQTPAGWPHLLAHLADQAHVSLTSNMAELSALPSGEKNALRPLRVLMAIHLAQVREIKKSGDVVLHQRLMLTPLRKWWIAQKVRWAW